MERVTVAVAPRKDKKKEVKANLPRPVRDLLTRRAEEHSLAPSAYAAKLTSNALRTETVIRGFAPYFRRGYVPLYARHSVVMGRVIGPDLEPLMPDGGGVTRFPVKFLPEDYLHVGELAYALSCSLSQALTIVLSEALLQGVTIESEGVAANG